MIDKDQEYVLKFDGAIDYLELSPNFSEFKTGITIEFLAKGKNGLTQEATIVEGYNTENERIFKIHLPYYKKNIGGCVSWEAGNDQGVDLIEKKVTSREYRIWTYWTFVKDFAEGKMSIYHNGKLWHQGESQYPSISDIHKIVIGSSEGSSQFWEGHLSEFRIWNKACKQEEIKEDRNERLEGDELGLSIYLPLNGDADDYSGHGNNATIHGTSWIERKIPLKVEQLPDEEDEDEEIEESLAEEESSPKESESRSVTAEPSLPQLNPSLINQNPNIMPQKKRLVICCDGTWNELSNSYLTNVTKFARIVKYTAEDNTPQLVFYLPGLGTADDNIWDKLGGGAFGWGIDQTIQEAYRLLCMNYDAIAQDEVYLLGFSRGAYIARCLGGMIYNCGLLRRSKMEKIPKAYELYRNHKISPNDSELQKFRQENSKHIDTEQSYLSYRVPLKMLGCWDTVGALGVPDIIPWLPVEKFFNQKYAFFDASLSPIIENAFHAIAIDEKSKSFPSTPMKPSGKNPEQKVEEVWFAGTHGCVGGGTKEYRGLSDYALQWMLNKAENLGLEFYSTEEDEETFQIKPDSTTKFDNSVTGIYLLGGEEWRSIDDSHVFIHHSVVERIKALPKYRPDPLKPLIKDLLDSDQ